MVKAIFFDFDGTLADTAPGIVLTMRESFRELGMDIPSEADIRQTIGLPLIDAMMMLGGLDREGGERATEAYRRLFPIYEVTHITIFSEVAQTLKALHSRGIRMAVCTSRGLESLESILGRNGLLEYFETSVTNSDHLAPKPSPEMVNVLLDRMRLQKEDVLVVGDTTFDIGMGNAAGCRTVAVTYGNHSLSQILEASPTFVIDRFSDLLSMAI